MKGIYLLLGSNLGDRQKIIKKAISIIERRIGEVVNVSSIYQTKAWGIEKQPDFLNQVVEVESVLTPEDMLEKILAIEAELGRIRYQKWHSRIIDIDILYFGDHVRKSNDLMIPHPENENRNFVLAPMAEIAPEFIHPILGISQIELLKNCKDPLGVEVFVNF